MTTKQQIQLAERFCNILCRAWDNISWTHYGSQYLRMNIDEERKHMKMKPAGVSHALTIKQRAQVIASNRIAKLLLGITEMPTIKGVISSKPSFIYGASVLTSYKEELLEQMKNDNFSNENLSILARMNYLELVGVSTKLTEKKIVKSRLN